MDQSVLALLAQGAALSSEPESKYIKKKHLAAITKTKISVVNIFGLENYVLGDEKLAGKFVAQFFGSKNFSIDVAFISQHIIRDVKYRCDILYSRVSLLDAVYWVCSQLSEEFSRFTSLKSARYVSSTTTGHLHSHWILRRSTTSTRVYSFNLENNDLGYQNLSTFRSLVTSSYSPPQQVTRYIDVKSDSRYLLSESFLVGLDKYLEKFLRRWDLDFQSVTLGVKDFVAYHARVLCGGNRTLLVHLKSNCQKIFEPPRTIVGRVHCLDPCSVDEFLETGNLARFIDLLDPGDYFSFGVPICTSNYTLCYTDYDPGAGFAADGKWITDSGWTIYIVDSEENGYEFYFVKNGFNTKCYCFSTYDSLLSGKFEWLVDRHSYVQGRRFFMGDFPSMYIVRDIRYDTVHYNYYTTRGHFFLYYSDSLVFETLDSGDLRLFETPQIYLDVGHSDEEAISSLLVGKTLDYLDDVAERNPRVNAFSSKMWVSMLSYFYSAQCHWVSSLTGLHHWLIGPSSIVCCYVESNCPIVLIKKMANKLLHAGCWGIWDYFGGGQFIRVYIIGLYPYQAHKIKYSTSYRCYCGEFFVKQSVYFDHLKSCVLITYARNNHKGAALSLMLTKIWLPQRSSSIRLEFPKEILTY